MVIISQTVVFVLLFFVGVLNAIDFFAFLGSVVVLPARIGAAALPVCTIPTFLGFSVTAAVFREVFVTFLFFDSFFEPFRESSAMPSCSFAIVFVRFTVG